MGRNNDDFLSAMGISRNEQEQMAHAALIGYHQDQSEKPQTTTPCINCGTPVDSDVHKEELGYCPECQHKYFNDYPVVGSHHYGDNRRHGDGCYICPICSKHTSTYEENENHRCFE